MVDADGNVLETLENPKFCGCGQSKEKPFCDGSHKGLLKENNQLILRFNQAL